MPDHPIFSSLTTYEQIIIIEFITQTKQRDQASLSEDDLLQLARIAGVPFASVNQALENILSKGVLGKIFSDSDPIDGWYVIHSDFYAEASKLYLAGSPGFSKT